MAEVATDWLVSALGGALVVLVLWDVFHTLWHPWGQGTLSKRVMGAVWRIRLRRGAPRGGRKGVGPLALMSVVALWAVLAVLGWALVYLPHLPEGFSYDIGLDPVGRSTLVDAVYLSITVLSTLGFGDIVPTDGWLRVATPLQALFGFTLLTAAVSWVLQVYPALSRRRALALHAATVVQASRAADAALPVPPSVLESLAAQVATARVDLTQHLETYYFQDNDCRTSLTHGLDHLERLTELAERSDDVQTRWAGKALQAAVDDLAAVLDSQFLRTGGSTDDVVHAYAAEHGHAHDAEG